MTKQLKIIEKKRVHENCLDISMGPGSWKSFEYFHRSGTMKNFWIFWLVSLKISEYFDGYGDMKIFEYFDDYGAVGNGCAFMKMFWMLWWVQGHEKFFNILMGPESWKMFEYFHRSVAMKNFWIFRWTGVIKNFWIFWWVPGHEKYLIFR